MLSLKLNRHFLKFHTDFSVVLSRLYSKEELPLGAKPSWVPFYKACYGNFIQEPPNLENPYTANPFFRNYIEHQMPKEILNEAHDYLKSLGQRVATDIHELALDCEKNVPYLETSDAWGNNVNKLVVCDSWNKQKDFSATEGMIAVGYQRRQYAQWARIYQFARIYLYAPSSGLYCCPLAMTDGAARTFEELHLLNQPTFSNAYQKLTSTDPDEFWTSGQWMTEKGGGSDVAGGTETVAIQMDSRHHKLYGYKWFSSATDANMALTLARVADDEGNVIQGSNGLTLFYVPVKQNNQPIAENINLIRLKKKLGTRQLPTAELLLDGALAIKICEEGRGVVSIANSMLQVTRIHNAVACASYLQRAYQLARDYSRKRKTFGRKLMDFPQHTQTLAKIDVISKATFLLAFENVRLLGLVENEAASAEEKLVFRILNPLAKLYNAKVAIPGISECLECLGGQGVVEDTAIPYLLRDAQVFAIWEGTTAVLAADVLRSIIKSNGETLLAFRSNVKSKLAKSMEHERLAPISKRLLTSLDSIIALVEKQPTLLESGSIDFAFSLANTFIVSLFIESAPQSAEAEMLATKYVHSQDMVPFLRLAEAGDYTSASNQANAKLVFEH